MKKQDKDMRIMIEARREEAKEVLDKLMIEARREEIRQNGEEARKLHREGKLKSFDNAKDLMNSLLED